MADINHPNNDEDEQVNPEGGSGDSDMPEIEPEEDDDEGSGEEENKTETGHDKWLDAYATELRTNIGKSGELFEKQFVYICAGTLFSGFYLTEKLFGKISDTSYKPLLYLTWVFLGLSLLLNLISHRMAIRNNSKVLETIVDNTYDYDHALKLQKRVGTANDVSLGIYFLGLVLLIIYISTNINMSNDKKHLDGERGMSTSAPPRDKNYSEKGLQNAPPPKVTITPSPPPKPSEKK